MKYPLEMPMVEFRGFMEKVISYCVYKSKGKMPVGRVSKSHAMICIGILLCGILPVFGNDINVAPYAELRGKYTYLEAGKSAVDLLRNVVDDDPSTAWRCGSLAENPTCFELVFARPVPIKTIRIEWGDPIGKDFDVCIYDGKQWASLAQARGNQDRKNGWACTIPAQSVRIDIANSVNPPHVAIAGIRLEVEVDSENLSELTPPKRRVAVPVTKAPPVIDGNIMPGEWDQAARLSDFRAGLYNDGPAPEKTEGFILQDQKHLYVAFRCEAKDPARFFGGFTKRDEPVHLDDHVEIFLDTTGDRKSYKQILCNFKGTLADNRADRYSLTSYGNDNSWDADVTARSKLREGGYDIELTIPWSSFADPNGVDATWGVNFARGHGKGLGYSIWAPTYGLYIWFPDKWGELTGLIFDPDSMRTDQVAERPEPLATDRILRSDLNRVIWTATSMEWVLKKLEGLRLKLGEAIEASAR